MREVLSVDKLRELAFTYIEIPGFFGEEKITVQVQKPRIMALASEGKVPNPLMGVATKMLSGVKNGKNQDPTDGAKMIRLYCTACLVKPKFEELEDIITDDQMMAIFDWAISGAKEIEPFRKNSEDGSSDSNEQEVPGETKQNS